MPNAQQSSAKQLATVLQSDDYRSKFAQVLPTNVSVERFQRTVVGALNRAPDLANADRRSFLLACEDAARDGLILDNREAALVVFKNKVQYMPMFQGLIKIATDGTKIRSISAHVVYENDLFKYKLGDDAQIIHEPELKDRGEAIGAYAIARMKDGTNLHEFMTVDEIEEVRAVSRAAGGVPWTKWWSSMARKTVIRRLFKYLPADALGDETHEEIVDRILDRDIVPSSEPETPHDPETGEIIEGDAQVVEEPDEPERAKAAVKSRKKAEDDGPPPEPEGEGEKVEELF